MIFFSKKDFKTLEDIGNTLKKDLTLGILFFELGSWVTGIIEYKKVLFSKRGSRYVKGKHKAGGQSQRRFERNREKWIESLQNKVYQDIKNYLLPEKNKLNYLSEMVLEDMIGDPDNVSSYGNFNQSSCTYSNKGGSNLHQTTRPLSTSTC